MTCIKTFKIRPFNPDITFLSGQCFRWKKENNIWSTVAEGKYAEINGEYPDIYISCNENDYSFWENYFDSSYDYEKISDLLARDKMLHNAVKCNRGMILLRQPFFETLISFIISANNNIPRIKSIIEKLSERYGNKTAMGHAFPEANVLAQLNENDLMVLGCGYRSKYIIETSKEIAKGFDYRYLESCNLNEARDMLCKFIGVGKKVADCVLIYSLGRKDAYPVDTWIRKASIKMFGEGLTDDEIRKRANERFGNSAALAQQYMFVAERMKKKTE